MCFSIIIISTLMVYFETVTETVMLHVKTDHLRSAVYAEAHWSDCTFQRHDVLPQVNNVKYGHEEAGNPSGRNWFFLGQNQFFDVHVCAIGVYVCGEDHEGRPCHLSTSLLRVLPAEFWCPPPELAAVIKKYQ